MAECEFTNMIMIQDPETGMVVAEKRVKYWCGYCFPGGHLENGESMYESAVREAREETGLEVRNLRHCGTVYWYNRKNGDRYLVFLYKTTDFTGELLRETEEGALCWVTLEDLMHKLPTPPNFREYLELFTNDDLQEAFCAWDPDDKPDFSKPNPQGIRYF